METIEAKLIKMKIRLNKQKRKFMESSLLIVYKIDAVKTFLLPILNFRDIEWKYWRATVVKDGQIYSEED
jgi:hypothetical protein